MHYGEKWFFDYDANLRQFFEDNKLDIPADGKSYGERIKDAALGNLASQGLIKNGMGSDDKVSVGQKAIQQAKDNQESEELKELKAKLAKIEKEKAELEANKVEKKPELKDTKKVAKKKEVAVK